MISIVLPWPPKQLFPNEAHRRTGAWGYADKARMLRMLAFGLTAQEIGPQKLRHYQAEGEVLLHTELTPPMRRGKPADEDNAMAALKPARDGIAAALAIDDSRFRQAQPVWHPREGAGKVVISWEA